MIVYHNLYVYSGSVITAPFWWKGLFINSQTRPLHSNEGNQTTLRALTRNHPEGWKLQGHVSAITTKYLTYRIANSHPFEDTLSPVAAILCTGRPDVIRKEAWSFYRTISGIHLCWELEEPDGPKGHRPGRRRPPSTTIGP